MPGRETPECIAVRSWLRQARGYEIRMREAVARERLLAGVPDSIDTERLRARQKAATDAWARAWADRAMAVDSVPDARWAAVLGYRYLQGMTIMQISVEMGIDYKTVQDWDRSGSLWLSDQGYPDIKKEAPR